MKVKEKTQSIIVQILVAVAVCIFTAIGFGAVTWSRGSADNSQVLAVNSGSSYMYRVLEIEPCWSYIYDDSDADTDDKATNNKNAMATALGCSASDIYFKSVSTAEFNGMNEDLVASYDIIVIGLQTGSMNTVNGSTIYNDRYSANSLNGYIYLAYGDLVKYDDRMAGMLPVEYMAIDDYVSGVVYDSSGYRWTFSNSVLQYGTGTGTGKDAVYITYSMDNGTAATTNWKASKTIYSMKNSAVWTPAMQQYFTANYPGENYFVLYSINSRSWSTNEAYYNDPIGNARFSGNDITKKKMNEIIDFISTGRPVILADKLFTCVSENNDNANSNKSAYPTSNMYSLLTAINSKDNIIKFSELSSKLAGIIHNPVLEITNHTMTYQNASDVWVTAPQISYASGLVDENCIIYDVEKFRYTVDFNATPNKAYFVKVIVDKDTDGRFDSEPTVDDFNEVYYATIVTADTETVHCQMDINLPEGYNGMFGWQILVEELDSAQNPIDRVSVEGHTVVKGQTKEIKVLQLQSGTAQALNMNMNNGSTYATYMKKAGNLLGYNVNVTVMNVDSFENLFKSNPYTKGESYKTSADYLNANGYNMLVIGFSDSFNKEDISDDFGALSCVTDYMENGNSVLFSHDTMQFQPSGNMGIAFSSVETKAATKYSPKQRTLYLKQTAGWNERAGVMMTLAMRDLVGMDRYSVTTMPSYSDQDKAAAGVPQKADGSYIYEIQGFSNLALMWLNIHRNYVTNVNSTKVNTLLPHNKLTAENTKYDNVRTQRVEEINEGQITMFPYDVTTTGYVDVDWTHSQYFQLDLEDDDVVVWYTLTSTTDKSVNGEMYRYMSRDAANNYYIYSKGNITYTGAGHVTCESGKGYITATQELKLFVNTVIRAATAGNFVPTVSSVNGSNTPVAGTYVVFPKPFDTEYLVQFIAYDEDLATKAVVKDSYPDEVEEHIGRFDSGAVYWNDNGTYRVLKTYSRTGSADNYLLNGEVEDFVIYNPLDRGMTMDQINANTLLKNMYDCYNAYNNNSQVDLVIEATDYYGETGSCIIQVVEQELFDLD